MSANTIVLHKCFVDVVVSVVLGRGQERSFAFTHAAPRDVARTSVVVNADRDSSGFQLCANKRLGH